MSEGVLVRSRKSGATGIDSDVDKESKQPAKLRIDDDVDTPSKTRFSGVTQSNFGLFDSTTQVIDETKVYFLF